MPPHMEAIRIVLAAASSMLLVMMMIISSASVELTEEAPSLSSNTTTTAAAAVSIDLHRSDDLFTMQFQIGGTTVSGMIADTGSDVIWTINSEWLNCWTNHPQMSCPASDNDPTSPSCDGRLCTFRKTYGGGAVKAIGVMGEAEPTFVGGGSAASDGYTTPKPIKIGYALSISDGRCNQHHQLSSSDDDVLTADESKACKPNARRGVVGLNRGELSLLNQLGRHSFSYCLPHHEDKTTTAQIKFYDDTAAAASSLDGTGTTLNLDDPAAMGKAFRNHYVVALKQILVGKTSCSVSSLDKDHHRRRNSDDGAMIIDSGTKYSVLPQEVFQCVDELVGKLLKKKTGKEIKHIAVRSNDGQVPSCWSGNKYPDELDSIQLNLYDNKERVTKRMEIPPKNYFYMAKTEDGKECYCLAFSGTDKKWSILGAYQQQDMRMVFDIAEGKNTLTFTESIGCGAKSQSQEDENHAAI